MIKDFDIVKKQLHELSGVVNAFKSEAVQLRVVELLFQRIGIEMAEQDPSVEVDDAEPAKRKTRRKKASSKPSETEKPKSVRTGKGGRPGPGAMVTQLLGSGFFDKPKTVQNIIDHCRSKFAYTYKPNEISVTMTRALRNETLKRQKNAEKQFEYYAK